MCNQRQKLKEYSVFHSCSRIKFKRKQFKQKLCTACHHGLNPDNAILMKPLHFRPERRDFFRRIIQWKTKNGLGDTSICFTSRNGSLCECARL